MAEFNEDVRVRGNIAADSYTFPDGSVGNNEWDVGSPLSNNNKRNQYLVEGSQDHSSPAAAVRKVIHRAKEKGTLLDFVAGNIVPAIGADTVDYDLWKNGASILGAVLTLTVANNNPLVMYAATIAGGGVYASGDVFELVITPHHSSGTLPAGIYWQARFDEDPSV